MNADGKRAIGRVAASLVPDGASVILASGTTAQAVADACVRKLAHRGKATGGLILLDSEGRPAAAFNTPMMAYGYAEPGGALRVFP